MPPPTAYSNSAKSILESKRREEANSLYEEMRYLMKCTDRMSMEDTVARAVETVTGKPFNPVLSSAATSDEVGPIKQDRKLSNARKEQLRRDKLSLGMDALKAFIVENKLGTNQQRRKLERLTVLRITCEHLRATSTPASVSSGNGATSSSSSSSSPPTSTPPIAAPIGSLPLVPMMLPFIFPLIAPWTFPMLPTLALPAFPVSAPSIVDPSVVAVDEDEDADIVPRTASSSSSGPPMIPSNYPFPPVQLPPGYIPNPQQRPPTHPAFNLINIGAGPQPQPGPSIQPAQTFHDASEVNMVPASQNAPPTEWYYRIPVCRHGNIGRCYVCHTPGLTDFLDRPRN
ncbi:unnamed protein product [Caenorhabditis sp. 36 PRJEB53466]|nr:unnamed protein product [Caenorhabditis sp. 36 PRJEB53466]